MVTKLMSFTDWLLDAGKEDELGMKCLLTYSILRRLKEGMLSATFNIIEKGLEKAVFERGSKPIHLSCDIQDDVFIPAKELIALIDTEGGASLQEYCGFLFPQCEKFFGEVVGWENRSLWGYVRWWIKRKLGRVETH